MVTPKEATTPIATATATATPPGVIDSISQHTRTYGSTEDAAADLHPTPSPRISIPSRSNSRSTSRHGSPTHTTHTGARTSIGKTLEEKHTPYRAIPIHEDLSTLVPSCCHGASYFNMMATSWCMWTIIIPFIILIPISEKVGMSDGQQMILRIVAGCMAGTGLVWIFYHARHVFIGGLCCQPRAPPQNGPLCRTHEGERQYHKIVIQKIYIICNPFGGVGKGMHILENICLPLCRDANVEVTVLKTEYAGHARDYAHTIDLSTHQGLCVIGGDGSFTEVINGLLTRTDKAIIPIGLIPAGSGNSCALDMQIPDAITAMRRVLSGDVCYIDANHVTDDGRLNVYSVNELSWGMVGDAAVMAEQIRWVGPSRYDLCAVWLVFRGVDKSLTITLDGQPPRTFSGKFVTAFVNQTQHFGKALRAAPHAKLDDGLMDLVFLREGTRGELLQLFQQLPNGAHTANSRVQFIQAPSIHLQPADPVGVINIDGENCRYDGIIRIVCKHKCLPVFIPPPMNAGAE